MRAILGAILCILTGFMGMIIVSSVLNGLVLVKLWSWFIVPTFALPVLSVPVAIGISILVKYLTLQKMPKDDNAGAAKIGEAYGFAIAYPILTLFIGWLVHFFV